MCIDTKFKLILRYWGCTRNSELSEQTAPLPHLKIEPLRSVLSLRSEYLCCTAKQRQRICIIINLAISNIKLFVSHRFCRWFLNWFSTHHVLRLFIRVSYIICIHNCIQNHWINSKIKDNIIPDEKCDPKNPIDVLRDRRSFTNLLSRRWWRQWAENIIHALKVITAHLSAHTSANISHNCTSILAYANTVFVVVVLRWSCAEVRAMLSKFGRHHESLSNMLERNFNCVFGIWQMRGRVELFQLCLLHMTNVWMFGEPSLLKQYKDTSAMMRQQC